MKNEGVAILFPVFVQIILPLALLVLRGGAPGCAVEKRVQLKDNRPGQRQWPTTTRNIRAIATAISSSAGAVLRPCLSTLQTANAII